jgi:two-component system chemotaxis response regulator CheY
MVVDDSGTMRKIVIRALNAAGFADTIEASDGAEALTVFQKSQVGIVLTDWNMPNKSGLDLTRDIRALGSKVPIFMITIEAEKGRVLEAIQAGVTDYLTNPFTQDTLQAKLQKYVNA